MSFQKRNIETPQNKKNTIIRIMKLIIWIVIIFLWIKYIGYSNFTTKILVEEKQNIIIEKWDNFDEISQKLNINSSYLKFYLKFNNPEYSLKVGKFEIPEKSNLKQILKSLEKPIFNTQNITLLEGWNIFDIDTYLTQRSLISKWEYIKYVENREKIIALWEFFPFLDTQKTLEWYLYPDTYKINPISFKINNFVILQLNNFEDKVYNKLLIDEINKKIYDRSDKKINEIYDLGKKITLDAFEEIYETLGTKFDYYFFESEMAPIGEKIVRDNVGKVFEKSDGAIVFYGEQYDKKLHTRVFINSQGLPTYETKEIGLTITKFNKEKDLDLSIVITAIEQGEYMKVVQKAISLIQPELEKKMKHVTHGMMRLAEGKMSSRKGNVITGESLISDSLGIIRGKIIDRGFKKVEQINISRQVGVSALKYSILKSSLGSNIIYDFEKSISFEGNSGPYLQYTAVRANSILEKAKRFLRSDLKSSKRSDLDSSETTNLEKILYQFPEIVEYSYNLLEPHHIATYLTELASVFNSFYNSTQILSEENQYISYHLDLVKAFYQTMKNGLWLLGIETPKKM